MPGKYLSNLGNWNPQLHLHSTANDFDSLTSFNHGSTPRTQVPNPQRFNPSNVIPHRMFLCPLYDRFLVPALRKMTHLEGGITLLQRIGIGMVFSILSMVVSGLVETSRRSGSANSMSGFWLAPQLIQVGFFDIMSIIGQIELFNKQFPEHMKSIANSVVFCSLGIASYLNGLLVTVVHYGTRRRRDLLANDLNVGRLDYFYYLISGFLGLNLVMFIWVARRYEYKETFKAYNDDDAGLDVELRTGKV